MSSEANPLQGSQVGVLIQDPHMLVRDCLRLVIEQLQGARVVAEVARPSEALELSQRLSPDIALIDLSNLDEAIRAISAITDDCPGVRIIGLADDARVEVVEAAVAAGATGLALKSESADDLLRAVEIVTKGDPTIAPNAAGPILVNYIKTLREKQQRDASIITSLASAVDAKDRYTGGHTQRVTRLAIRIAEQLDPDLRSNEQLRYGFMLHDVGKIGVPERILLKDGSLTTDEWAVMRTHPIIGLQIIEPVGLGADVENVVRHHHERWDGGGYPDGLSEEEIPFGARLFSVADAFDAMTSDRPYRKGMPAEQAVEQIRAEAGSQFDPKAVDSFVAVAGG